MCECRPWSGGVLDRLGVVFGGSLLAVCVCICVCVLWSQAKGRETKQRSVQWAAETEKKKQRVCSQQASGEQKRGVVFGQFFLFVFPLTTSSLGKELRPLHVTILAGGARVYLMGAPCDGNFTTTTTQGKKQTKKKQTANKNIQPSFLCVTLLSWGCSSCWLVLIFMTTETLMMKGACVGCSVTSSRCAN